MSTRSESDVPPWVFLIVFGALMALALSVDWDNHRTAKKWLLEICRADSGEPAGCEARIAHREPYCYEQHKLRYPRSEGRIDYPQYRQCVLVSDAPIPNVDAPNLPDPPSK